jgi:subfamily B ATP-binding cassette protein HlyB/CyaB
VQSAERLDSGLTSLSLIAGYYRIAADPAQLRHQLALTGRLAEKDDLLRAANLLQLKSRVIVEWTRSAWAPSRIRRLWNLRTADSQS